MSEPHPEVPHLLEHVRATRTKLGQLHAFLESRVEHLADLHRQLAQLDAAQRLLQQALSLPVTYREPLILRCIRSMTYQQISDVLGLPVTTVETRLARARRMLREEVGDDFLEDSASDQTQQQ